MRIATIITLTLAALLTLGAVPAALGQEITGTWMTTVTPPVEAGAPAFKLIFSFMSDRNLLASGAAGELPALGNPCHGVWAKTGAAEFTLTYLCLDYDANLQFVGYDKIGGLFTIDRVRGLLTGKLNLTNFDTDGKEVFSACCAAVEGTRLEVEKFSEEKTVNSQRMTWRRF